MRLFINTGQGLARRGRKCLVCTGALGCAHRSGKPPGCALPGQYACQSWPGLLRSEAQGQLEKPVSCLPAASRSGQSHCQSCVWSPSVRTHRAKTIPKPQTEPEWKELSNEMGACLPGLAGKPVQKHRVRSSISRQFHYFSARVLGERLKTRSLCGGGAYLESHHLVD